MACRSSMRTTYTGGVEGTFTSLSFGDAQTPSGSDLDSYHYAQLDYDSETTASHAQFRQYNSAQGRWMSSDPYVGSYNPFDPQSMNRYSYVQNNPLGFIDPLGLAVKCYDQGDANIIIGDYGYEVFGYSQVCYDDGPPGGRGGNGNGTESPGAGGRDGGGGRNNAPSNGPTRGQCAAQALKSDGNGVSLALDVAGIGAGFLPGGGLVTGSARAATVAFGAQVGLTAASTGVSVAYKSGPGIVAGILGGQVALTAKSVEAAGEQTALLFGKSIPIVGVAVSTGALLYDGYQTYKAYAGCLAGVHE